LRRLDEMMIAYIKVIVQLESQLCAASRIPSYCWRNSCIGYAKVVR
jgi:hypothetical protein